MGGQYVVFGVYESVQCKQSGPYKQIIWTHTITPITPKKRVGPPIVVMYKRMIIECGDSFAINFYFTQPIIIVYWL